MCILSEVAFLLRVSMYKGQRVHLRTENAQCCKEILCKCNRARVHVYAMHLGVNSFQDSVFWMQEDKVWVYPPEKKENGYPKLFQEEFPGIPYPPDAAVECHRGECQSEGVLFFQGVSTQETKHREGVTVLMVGCRALLAL